MSPHIKSIATIHKLICL